MKVMNCKQFKVGGRTFQVSHYNMPFQGQVRGDFNVIEWNDGWVQVAEGKATTLADAVAQAKAAVTS